MISWKNLDSLAIYDSFMALKGKVDLAAAMTGKNGAKRVAAYNVPMPEGFTYNFAAKAVDDEVLSVLKALAEEHQLVEKYEALCKWNENNYEIVFMSCLCLMKAA